MSGSWLTFKKVAVSRLSDLAICRSLYIYNLHHSKLLNWGWIFSFLFWFFFPPHPSQAVYFIINNKLWCHGVFIHLSILVWILKYLYCLKREETLLRRDTWGIVRVTVCSQFFIWFFFKWNIGADLSFDSLSGTCVDVCSRSPWSCDF